MAFAIKSLRPTNGIVVAWRGGCGTWGCELGALENPESVEPPPMPIACLFFRRLFFWLLVRTISIGPVVGIAPGATAIPGTWCHSIISFSTSPRGLANIARELA